MPAEFWTEAARMTTSGVFVALVAVPVGLFAWTARPREPFLPRWKPWRVPWNGFEVIVGFVVVMLVLPPFVREALGRFGFYHAIYGPDFPPTEYGSAVQTPTGTSLDPEQYIEANTLRGLWANVFALPLQLALLGGAVRALYPKWQPTVIGTGSTAGKVSLAVLAWLVLAPLVLGFNAVVNAISQQQGVPPESHALTRLSGRPVLDQVLFVIEACVGAPLREELLIRGLMLAWCVGRMKLPGAGVSPMTAARPWFVMVAAVAFAASSEKRAPMIFAAVLVVGLAGLWRFKRSGARRARAVYATAAFFALMHSAVWPNPVPLFVLGLGLGWLAVRTNGVLVPVLVHGLFNAVSVVFVLRGGAG